MSGRSDSGYDHNCRWVLADSSYCEKKVGWTMQTLDEGTKMRYYDPFCKEHMAKHLADLANPQEADDY